MLAKPAELELPLLGGGAEGHRESLFFSSMDNENRLESSDPYGQGPIFTAGFALFIASYLVGFVEWCVQHSRDANACNNSTQAKEARISRRRAWQPRRRERWSHTRGGGSSWAEIYDGGDGWR